MRWRASTPATRIARREAARGIRAPAQLPPAPALRAAERRAARARRRRSRALFARALRRSRASAAPCDEIDFAPVRARPARCSTTAPGSPSGSEATGALLGARPDALHPAVREILESALRYRRARRVSRAARARTGCARRSTRCGIASTSCSCRPRPTIYPHRRDARRPAAARTRSSARTRTS